MRALFTALTFAVVVGVLGGSDSAAAAVAQVPPGESSAVAEEAPSSLTTGDQVRAFTVLGVCLLAIVLPVALVALRSRRRRGESPTTSPPAAEH